MPQTFDLQQFRQLLTRLACTPGPSLLEGPRIAVLEEFFRERQIECRRDAANNLLAPLVGGPWDQTLILDAHVDVVGRGMAEAVIESEGKLIGAGVGDNLTAVTMLAMLAEKIASREIQISRPLTLLFSVGEEGLGDLKGMRQLLADHPEPPRLLVSWDGGYNEFSVAGLGSLRYRVAIEGPGGHSWNDYGRPSAIDELATLVLSLKDAVQALDQGASRLTFNTGTFVGGEGINVIARYAETRFEFRSIDPSLLSPMSRMVEIVANVLREKSMKVTLELIGERPAGAWSNGEEIIAQVRSIWAARQIELHETIRSTNINVPLAADWPAICLGLCHSGNTHRSDEYVHIDSLETGWNLLTTLCQTLAN